MTTHIHQVRPFFTKINLQQSAVASAYLETNSSSSQNSTKIACAFFGPMQATAMGSAADSCQVKVSIEFADEQKSALLSQLPIVDETLQAQAENLPTEAVTQMHMERKMKEQINQLTQTMSSVLTSAIATEQYSGTKIEVTFSIVELDCDIVQAMTNCASVALLNSTLKCRYLPAAICVLQEPTEQTEKDISGVSQVDPTSRQLCNQTNFAQKLRLIYNVDTEELVYSNMESFKYGQQLSLDTLERVIGTGMTSAKKLHKLILQSGQSQ